MPGNMHLRAGTDGGTPVRRVGLFTIRFRGVERALFSGKLKYDGNAAVFQTGTRSQPSNTQLFFGGPLSYRAADDALIASAQHAPVRVGRKADRTYWLFQDSCYWDTQDLSEEDATAVFLMKSRRSREQVEHARSLSAVALVDRDKRRRVIPADVKLLVAKRDNGACIECASNVELQFDHVIPSRSEAQHTGEPPSFLAAPATGANETVSRECNQRDWPSRRRPCPAPTAKGRRLLDRRAATQEAERVCSTSPDDVRAELVGDIAVQGNSSNLA